MTPDDRPDLYRGLDDAWTHAIELVLTPVVAGGLGYLVDRVLVTVPVFTIAMVVLAVLASFVKMYYSYDARMRAHDAASPWGARERAERAERDLVARSPGRS